MLETHIKPSTPRVCAVIAYYPTAIPPVSTKFPFSVRILVHLAGSEVGIRRRPEVLGIQSTKMKTIRKRVDPGVGYGGCIKIGFKTYAYPNCAPGFAEHDVDEYDAVNERLAFSRSLAVVKRAFRMEEDLDVMRDELVDLVDEVETDKVLKRTMPFAHVINGPTLVGGAGTEALRYFYDDLFEHDSDIPYDWCRSRGRRAIHELYTLGRDALAAPIDSANKPKSRNRGDLNRLLEGRKAGKRTRVLGSGKCAVPSWPVESKVRGAGSHEEEGREEASYCGSGIRQSSQEGKFTADEPIYQGWW
jgi:hypothetical protein